MRVIDRVRVPARIITAEDDPFVPSAPFRDPSVTANPCLHVTITTHGGHCAFVSPTARRAASDGYWAEHEILAFASSAHRR